MKLAVPVAVSSNLNVSTPLPPVAATWPRPSALVKVTFTPPVSAGCR